MTEKEHTDLIKKYISQYKKTGKPININFRQIIPEINNTDRYTHSIHPYPAKLLTNIPYFFLQTSFFCPPNGVVLDPFCGAGTVMLEAYISGRCSLGADANPLATLITQVKTQYIPSSYLEKNLASIIKKVKRNRSIKYSTPTHIQTWFSPSTINQLAHLEEAINKIVPEEQRRFFLLCLSNVVRKVSFADTSISVPVRLNPNRFVNNPERKKATTFKLKALQCIDVYDKFENVCKINIKRIATLQLLSHHKDVSARVISNDVRNLTDTINGETKIPNESIDLILTSPPYAGAQKYIRSSWLNLFWLGQKTPESIRTLKNKNIGRENYSALDYKQKIKTNIKAADKVLNSLYKDGKYERAFIVGNYLNEMKAAMDECIRVLKTGGYMVIVIGNNTVCKRPFNTQDYLTTYLQQKGLNLQFKLIDDIKSYGLMTKRNQTASMISSEWVLVLKK